MSQIAHAPQDVRLSRVEALLTGALDDLTAAGGAVPGSRCVAALAEAASELQAFTQAHSKVGVRGAALRKQLSGLLPLLHSLDRLLTSAAEFYRGWCAAAPLTSYPAPYAHEPAYGSGQSYPGDGWSNERGPALLAFRG